MLLNLQQISHAFSVIGPHYENTEISAYVTRGSVALLEEIDQSNNDAINDDITKEENHFYVNVKISRISSSSLWEYTLTNIANGNFLTEFQVYFFIFIKHSSLFCN